MPESSAERKRLARRAADRRQATNLLQIGECGCRYAASVLANGASPSEARAVATEMAGELTAIAEGLRRLTRVGPAERRTLAAQMAGLGLTTKQIADRLGVSERCARYYVAGRSSRGRDLGLPLLQAGERISRYCRVLRAAPDGAPNTHPGPWPL